MVDRKARVLEEGQWAVVDGDYSFDLATKTLLGSPIRPPVSKEVYGAWKKLRRFPPMMFGVRKKHERFEIDPEEYDSNDRSKLIENPRLRSPAMMSRSKKYREVCKAWYLKHVSRNIYTFAAYELVVGRCWSDHELVQAYAHPPMGPELVLELEGRHLGRWVRVSASGDMVRPILRHLRQRGDVVVAGCQVARPRAYCTVAWREERARRIARAIDKNWRAPKLVVDLLVEEWLEYYAPPHEDGDLLLVIRD